MPATWWSSSDLRAIDGVAAALTDAGVEVLLLGAEDDDPYAFMHAKLAVRDARKSGSVGNWKSSSTPQPGDSGNRDWGLLVNSTELATTLGELLAMDRDAASVYVRPANAGTPTGWSLDAPQSLSGSEVEAVAGTASGDVLTCPDDCILGLVGMLDAAQSEALLSLQYLEMDWTWGWGDNPSSPRCTMPLNAASASAWPSTAPTSTTTCRTSWTCSTKSGTPRRDTTSPP